MKKKIWAAFLISAVSTHGFAQRNCGQQAMLDYFEQANPGTKKQIETEREKAFSRMAAYSSFSSATSKTSTSVLIPVVFHIVLDTNQFIAIGGIPGIENRIKTQMQVINDDFNANNADKIKVPSVWASVFANVGISFGLAHVHPSGIYTPGYDIKIVPVGTSYRAEDGAKAAKFTASGGLEAWDNAKYFNVWIVNLKTSGSTALGITAPPGFPSFTKPELGIALNYLAFGSRTSPGQQFIRKFDRGRTLTHELGHYFYLWHVWGDDGGTCTGDDGFTDTPLQADATTGAPSFPRFDICTSSGNGIMFMNYMDYSDDSSLYMFTKQQAAMVNSQLSLGGYSHSLTLNPNLSDTQFKPARRVIVGPNPTDGILYLSYGADNPPERIIVFNILGQKMIETTEPDINSIDMSFMAKGIYFVHCYFRNEIVKQKIRLQ